ncbi:deoxymugineic acid synthase 1-like [Curcuma longa]|uniref:deoxymugineic acid synthase 1-like n=1 Tax=Curcuma longa TaxID=136217 RepID=UPI003D9E5F5E
MAVPQITLRSGSTPMPRVGLGTASFPLSDTESTRAAVLRAIELGYRHLDTAALYGSEEAVGQAVAEALSTGLIASRDELFITSKLWIRDAQAHLVLPALQRTLKNLQLEYLNLYLIHFPISAKPQGHPAIITEDELMPIDLTSVWRAMEECQRMGLTKSIGVSNFSSKKIETLLATAEIPPAANQVEVNPLWQQKKLREFCVAKGIQFCAFSPLGGKGTGWGKDWVMECDVLHEIAKAKGKSVAQICLRWVFEQGDVVIVKTFKENEMLENLDILNWELTEEERDKISRIPQRKSLQALELVSEKGPYKSSEELWDDCI